MNRKENFTAGFIRENPVFSLYLGLCSTLAITTTLNNAIGMGVAVIVVLIMSNVIISLIRNITPSEIRIPVYIVIIATLVKIIQMLIKAYAPSLDSALGVFIPLIVVNCIILGRAEAFASKNGVFDSALDGLGMGLGYTVSSMFSQPFGAFCTFACLAAGLAAYKSHQQNKAKKLEKEAK